MINGRPLTPEVVQYTNVALFHTNGLAFPLIKVALLAKAFAVDLHQTKAVN